MPGALQALILSPLHSHPTPSVCPAERRLPPLGVLKNDPFWNTGFQCLSGTFLIRPYGCASFATVRVMGHSLAYASISTAEQHLDLLRDALERAGCERIFSDTASGALDERPQLAKVIGALRSGDTLVVWRLNRLGRSLRHLIDTLNDLRDRGVRFRSLQESIDTSTSGGKLVFHVFGALAESNGS